jgi:hypothetical protein
MHIMALKTPNMLHLHNSSGVSVKATIEELSRKIEEAHELLYPEDAGRSTASSHRLTEIATSDSRTDLKRCCACVTRRCLICPPIRSSATSCPTHPRSMLFGALKRFPT